MHNDIVSRMIDFEMGLLDESETLDFFQDLVDTGMAWSLQGSYGRMANALINEGLILSSDRPRTA